MRQSNALLGRLTCLVGSPAPATSQPLHALARRTAGDGGFNAMSALHRFLSSATPEHAQQDVPPSSGEAPQHSTADAAPEPAASIDAPAPESAAIGSDALGNAPSERNADGSIGSGEMRSQSGPVQTQDHGNRAPRNESLGAALRKVDVASTQQELDRLLKQNRPGDALEVFKRFKKGCGPRPDGRGDMQPGPPLTFELCRLALIAIANAPSTSPSVVSPMRKHLAFMRSRGVEPDARMSCFLLSVCAREESSSAAFAASAILKDMQDVGLRISSEAYDNAITACTAGMELGIAIKLLKEMQRAPLVVLNSDMRRMRELYTILTLACARRRRMDDCLWLIDEAGLHEVRLGPKLLQEVLYFACEQARPDVLMECVRLLLGATIKQGGVQRPLRMEEGCMLAVLNVAAKYAKPALAREAWRLLVRSLVQPPVRWLNNPPVDRPVELAREAQELVRHAERAAMCGTLVPGTNVGGGPDHPAASAEALNGSEVAGQVDEDEQSGVAPSVPSFHAYIHAHAAAHDLRGAFIGVGELQKRLPEMPQAASYHKSLSSVVNALAENVEHVDNAYFVLEEMADQGYLVTIEMLNTVIAASSQMGDLARTFETFEAAAGLQLVPNTDTYNAIMEGCVSFGQSASIPKLRDELESAGLSPNRRTYELITSCHIVQKDVPAMIASLKDMEAAGFEPPVQLLERCLERSEREGDAAAMARVMEALELQAYKIIGAASKVRRWQEEGGMHVLSGSRNFQPREMSDGYKHPQKLPGLAMSFATEDHQFSAEEGQHDEGLTGAEETRS